MNIEDVLWSLEKWKDDRGALVDDGSDAFAWVEIADFLVGVIGRHQLAGIELAAKYCADRAEGTGWEVRYNELRDAILAFFDSPQPDFPASNPQQFNEWRKARIKALRQVYERIKDE